jgi:type II secretory pathway pseudopilin PulG
MRSGSARAQEGFTLIALLLVVALMGFGLAGLGELWSRSAQREREQELLFAGNQIREAIGQYYRRSPGGANRFPRRLEDLLQDERYPVVVRHLRRLYSDPMTGSPAWGLIEAPGGGVMGVYSLSGSVPLQRAGFAVENKDFENAAHYTGWRFLFNPEAARAAWAERTTPKR